jgi:hypothetical protein
MVQTKWIRKLTFEDCIEITKKYSEEIEYSEENLEKLADASYEKDEFSTENLLGLFRWLKYLIIIFFKNIIIL